MFPMNRRVLHQPITVEYTSRGKRVEKTLPDSWSARRFYAAKDRAGKHPVVVHKQASA